MRRFTGNAHGTLDLSVAGGGVVKATYRGDGLLMSRTDPMGATTTFERDARGRITKVTDPLDRVTVIERDADGLPIRIPDPAGGVTSFERDSRGNIVTATDAAGAMTSYRYDDRGLVTEEVSPTGARRTHAYNAQANATESTEPSGGVWRFRHDAFGRRVSVTDPTGAETRYTYSNRGEVVAVREADGGVTRYAYDGEGHLLQVEDPKGRLTRLTWGGYHKLCARRDANGHEVRLRYNLEGELVEVHNERGEVHRLTYDWGGKLVGETTFDGRELRYRNDLAGRVERAENGLRQVTNLTYDLAGQLIRRELDDHSIEELSYNARGELIRALGPAGELRLERDAVGRVVREVQVSGSSEHWVTIEYDPDGERVRRTTSLGHSEVVTRGLLGERTQTVLDGEHVVEHSADALGREIARALPGGGWIESAYDSMGRVVRRSAGGGATRRGAGSAGRGEAAVDTTYRYDKDGELVEAQDRQRGATHYQYDPIGQLLAMVPERARAEVFRYDPTGNVYEAAPDAEPREYGPGNRLLRKGTTEYTWDSDGRLVEKRERDPETGEERRFGYSWNAAGLLRAVERPDRTRVEFLYDPFARRLEKAVSRPGRSIFERVPVSVTRFVWDGDVLVHEITARAQEGGDPVLEERTYCFEDDGFAPVAHREGRRDREGRREGGWFHYVNDPIGTPERLIGEDGGVACELRRNAWGSTPEHTNAITPIRFPGQHYDAEVGLCYNRYRYYEPSIGQFTSPDPINLANWTNYYKYAINPICWSDPLGLASQREAERLIEDSQGKTFGNNLGHALDHIPGPNQNPAVLAASRSKKKTTTVFRSRNQATRALREIMTRDCAKISALPPGGVHSGSYKPRESLEGFESVSGKPAQPVSINRVTYVYPRPPPS